MVFFELLAFLTHIGILTCQIKQKFLANLTHKFNIIFPKKKKNNLKNYNKKIIYKTKNKKNIKIISFP